MSLKTRYNLFKIKRSLSPSAVFKASLQKDLDQAWDAKYGKVSWFHSGLMYRAGAMAVAVLVLAGSGGAYAYNSPDVTEGNILYPVKKVIENVEEITKITPEAKAKFLLKKIERREAERAIIKKNEVEDQIVESEQEDITPTEAINLESKKAFIKKDRKIDARIENIDKSIQEAEDKLEQFNDDLDKVELKDNKLQEEFRVKIEQRLEKRKERLQKASEMLKNRSEKLQELEDKNIEKRGSRSDLRNASRLEKNDEQDGN